MGNHTHARVCTPSPNVSCTMDGCCSPFIFVHNRRLLLVLLSRARVNRCCDIHVVIAVELRMVLPNHGSLQHCGAR